MSPAMLSRFAVAATLLASVAACTDPYDPGQRAVGGGLLGAGTGAAIGALAGGGRGAAIGALAGGAIGAAGGAATTPRGPGPYYAPSPGYYAPPPQAYYAPAPCLRLLVRPGLTVCPHSVTHGALRIRRGAGVAVCV